MNKQTIEIKDYIIWLENYTKKHPTFTSDEYLFSSKKMPDIDKKNTESLGTLYELIKNYATENFILPQADQLGYHYQITYNGNSYKIGYMQGHEFFYYCTATTPNKENTIDFNDILENKRQFKTEMINLKLQKIAILTGELKIAGLEESFVLDTVTKTYRKIR